MSERSQDVGTPRSLWLLIRNLYVCDDYYDEQSHCRICSSVQTWRLWGLSPNLVSDSVSPKTYKLPQNRLQFWPWLACTQSFYNLVPQEKAMWISEPSWLGLSPCFHIASTISIAIAKSYHWAMYFGIFEHIASILIKETTRIGNKPDTNDRKNVRKHNITNRQTFLFSLSTKYNWKQSNKYKYI